MSGRTTAGSIQDCSLADRILLTLHLADRREYGMSLAHIPKMLIYREAEEEKVRVMLSSMPSVSHKDGIYCLKGSECSMASGGFSEDDDIDFNIFTERGCKYTMYLLGILLSMKYSVKHRENPLRKN